jgi:hypothetical protein
LIRISPYPVVLLTFGILAASCAVIRECPIETLQPAKITLEAPRQSVAVFASPDIFSESFLINKMTDDMRTDSLILNLLYSLKYFMEQAPGFENTEVSVFLAAQDSVPKDHDWFVGLNRLPVRNISYGGESLEVRCVAAWSIYNRDTSFTDKYIDVYAQVWKSDEDISGGAGDSEYELTDKLPSIEDAWWDLGITVARACAAYLTPHWQREMRGIYMINRFPDLSVAAYAAMQNEDYDGAFAVWEKMLTLCSRKGQKNTKRQITYNMAIACEYLNLPDEAIRWAQRSVDHAPAAASYRYLEFLEERKEQAPILDKQINQ